MDDTLLRLPNTGANIGTLALVAWLTLVAGPRDQRRAHRDQAHRDAATLRDLTRKDDDA